MSFKIAYEFAILIEKFNSKHTTETTKKNSANFNLVFTCRFKI